MAAPISVIIPTLNDEQRLGACLAALVPGLTDGLIRELIVTDGGSSDQTLKIADAAGARIITGATGRGAQLAAGADVAQGAWLLFLHSDTVLSVDWSAAVSAHMQNHRDQAAYLALAFDTDVLPARLTAAWANFRARLFSLPYGDQGLLISSGLYSACGGFEGIPLMEDVAIARALKGRFRRLDATATTSAERYLRDGWVRRGASNLTRLLLYFLGRDPKALAERYHR